MMSGREHLLQGFIGEVKGYIPQIKKDLDELKNESVSGSQIEHVHRLFHNIKGAASQLSLADLSASAHIAEEVLEGAIFGDATLDHQAISFLDATADRISHVCETGLVARKESQDLLEATLASLQKLNLNGFNEQALLAQYAGEEMISASNSADKISEFLPIFDKVLLLIDELRKILTKPHGQGSDTSPILGELADSFSDMFSMVELQTVAFGQVLLESLQMYIVQLQYHPQQLDNEGLQLLIDGFSLAKSLGSDSGEYDDAGIEEIILALHAKTEGDEDQDISSESDEIPDFITAEQQPDQLITADDQGEQFPHEIDLPPEILLSSAGDAGVDEEDDELLQIFQMECEEHLQVMSNTLVALESIVDSVVPLEGEVTDHLGEMRRAMHTLKGAASMTGFTELAGLAHASEDLLDAFFDISHQVKPDDISLLARAIDVIESQAAEPGTVNETLLHEIEALLRHAVDAMDTDTGEEQEEQQEGIVTEADGWAQEDDLEIEILGEPVHSSEEKTPAPLTPETAGKNADTTGKNTNVRVKLANLDELVSLEGELLISRNSMEKRFSNIAESIGELNLAKERLQRIANELEQGFEVESLFGFGQRNMEQGPILPGVEKDYADFDPIELDRYSQMSLIIRSLNELSVDIGAIHAEMTSTAGEIRGQIGQQQLLTRVMQDKLKQVRMTPMSSITRTFFRTVRDTSRQLQKVVRLQVEGEEVYLDRFIWSKVVDPIMHILRNCVDHGIEGPAERRQANKTEEARILLTARQKGSHVLLKIEDDGRGINYDAVRKKLEEKKLIDDQSNLTDQQLQEYLFAPGFSTSSQVSQISGRGVGLDVVRKNIQELRGSVRIDSKPGEGTVFLMHIPATLTINRVVMVSIAQEKFAVPLADIYEIRRVSTAECYSGEDGSSISIDGEMIQLVELHNMLGVGITAPVAPSREVVTVLLTENVRGKVAFQIDQVHEQQEIVVKSLGSHLVHVQGISGATTNADGTLLPILNLSELANLGVEKITPQSPINPSYHTQTARVMIVDDSVSVRTSVARLVKDIGWEPLLANDGVDATEKIGGYNPDVIILDIEMPRMNGFEFMAVLRNSEEFKHIPVVMLTSRVSDKHKDKAKELGVNRYVYKPYERQDFITLLRDTVDGAGVFKAA